MTKIPPIIQVPDNSQSIVLAFAFSAGMGVIFGLVSAVPFFLVFAATRERKEYSEQPEPSLRESLPSTPRLKRRPSQRLKRR